MKRLFDLSICVLFLPIILMALLIIAVLVRQKIGAPVFFIQNRAGVNGLPFKMIKFRTMTNDLCENGDLLPDSNRITEFGRWLRRTSLDEIPEFLNVLLGNMSIVGPRPLLQEYNSLYTDRQKKGFV